MQLLTYLKDKEFGVIFQCKHQKYDIIEKINNSLKWQVFFFGLLFLIPLTLISIPNTDSPSLWSDWTGLQNMWVWFIIALGFGGFFCFGNESYEEEEQLSKIINRLFDPISQELYESDALLREFICEINNEIKNGKFLYGNYINFKIELEKILIQYWNWNKPIEKTKLKLESYLTYTNDYNEHNRDKKEGEDTDKVGAVQIKEEKINEKDLGSLDRKLLSRYLYHK